MFRYFVAMTIFVAGLYAVPAAASDARQMIADSARKHGVPVSLALGVGHVESGFRCNAVGRAGEVGPMQIKPATARGVGHYVNHRSSCADKIEASMRYLKQAIARGGQGCAGIALYNRGIYARPVCTAYGRKVLGAMRFYR